MTAPWGAMLEAELAGAAVVRAHVLSHGPAEVPDWVRGRQAPAVVFAGRAEASDAVTAAWDEQRVFFLREVPALRLDTTQGRLLVVDRWGDTGFRPIAQRVGAGVLRLDTPICTLLAAVDLMRTLGGPLARVDVVSIGWRETQEVTRRDELATWVAASVPVDPGRLDDPDRAWSWRAEPSGGIGDGPWAAMRAFGQVNSREDILRSARVVQAAAPSSPPSSPSSALDVDDIEAYLRAFVTDRD